MEFDSMFDDSSEDFWIKILINLLKLFKKVSKVIENYWFTKI